MRFAYATTSVALATGVVLRALHQRANFYSACVYLAQSNACLMILTNLALLCVCTLVLGLQRVFYGPLRAIEVEQLYEKAWFAITETCLAMTIFREEVGGWFLVMFVALLIGKVWGWIGEGRVEILEQQPPQNPRFFHARLSFSLILSLLFDIEMLHYSIQTVLLQARPNMMVMFAFEFAVLFVTTMSTAARYYLSLHEAAVVKMQTSSRRAQLRQERANVRSSADTRENTAPLTEPPRNDSPDGDIDSMDIDVPGWEEKGRWVFYLDLMTDFLKLVLYLTFFCVLCVFYGMPIHIIRDVALTIRSFYKRVHDFARYRKATRDMNARYPDATQEEVVREDVCIICREEMRPWQPNATHPNQAAAGEAHRPIPPSDERLRPKRLPCGHILHFACLRSWLERQQNCPTCRRPVLVDGQPSPSQNLNQIPPQNVQQQPQVHQAPLQQQAPGNAPQPLIRQNVYALGPFRFAFAVGRGDPAIVQQPPYNNTNPLNQQRHDTHPGFLQRGANTPGLPSQTSIHQDRASQNLLPPMFHTQLHQIEQHILREIYGLQIQANQLHLVQALQSELARLRLVQATTRNLINTNPLASTPHSIRYHPQHGLPNSNLSTQQQPHGNSETNHQAAPLHITLPPGWTLLPLHRIVDATNPSFSVVNNMQGANSSTPTAQTEQAHADRSVFAQTPDTSQLPRANTIVIANPASGAVSGHGQSTPSPGGITSSMHPSNGAAEEGNTNFVPLAESIHPHLGRDDPNGTTSVTETNAGPSNHSVAAGTPNAEEQGRSSKGKGRAATVEEEGVD